MTKTSSKPSSQPAQDNSHKISLWIARAGICSRRQAERYIKQGRITLEGKPIRNVATRLKSPQGLKLDGKPLPPQPAPTLYLFYKPPHCLTTHQDPQNRPTIFNILPPHQKNLITIGRLDFNSEGLLLLTNNGALSRFLTLPAHGFARVYRVMLNKKITQETKSQWQKGLTIKDIHYQGMKVDTEKDTWVKLTLYEGKNREIRRIATHGGYHVRQLIRIQYANFKLGKLKKGEIIRAPQKELSHILKLYEKNMKKM